MVLGFYLLTEKGYGVCLNRYHKSFKTNIYEVKDLLKDNGIYEVDINGVVHWIKIAGRENNTTPLILLHGGPGGNHYSFERTAGPLLEQKRTIVYYEQRGSGRSEKPISDEDYTIHILIEDFMQILSWLEVRTVDLLGYSFGAELALEIAYAKPESIHKLILSGPSLMGSGIGQLIQVAGFMSVVNSDLQETIKKILNENGSFDQIYNQIWALADEHIVDRLLFENQEMAQLNRRYWEESGLVNSGLMRKGLLKSPMEVPLLNRLPAIKQPALLITGLFDRNTGVSISKLVENSMPDCRWEIFNKSAHFPDIEESAKFVQISLDFLCQSSS